MCLCTLPDEILMVILSHLTYQDLGRLMVVNTRWERLIEELLPAVRCFNIQNPKKYVWGLVMNGLDKYGLYSEFRGKPSYKSLNLWRMKNNTCRIDKLSNMFLYNMDGVWYSSFVLGEPDTHEGYLQSLTSSSTPQDTPWVWIDIDGMRWVR